MGKFDNALSEGRDLAAEAARFRPVRFREELVSAIAKSLALERCVLLVGPAGVGKTSVVRALACELASGGKRKLIEFDSSQMLTGTVYLGEWQSKVASIFSAAEKAKAVLYFSDIWNLPAIGVTSSSRDSVWDVLRPKLAGGSIQLVGEISDEQLQLLRPQPGFATLFDVFDVEPLSRDQISTLVLSEGTTSSLEFGAETAARVLDLCNQFLPSVAGPGPALRLVAQIRHYLEEKRAIGEEEPLTPSFVEKVFSVYTGLPRFIVSRQETRPVTEIRNWFRSRIIGQKSAIDAVVQMIAMFKAGLHDAGRPIGSFLFVGPTGVGKTELAKALAAYLFGSEKRFLRIDMSEFKDYHSYQILIGDPAKPERPARLVDAVRNEPFQIVLLDEIEKAHSNIWDLLLQLLDDGRLTPASGPAVNFRNTIVIATSNVGAQALDKRSVGFSGGSTSSDTNFQHELEAVFRPELLNRFQSIIRFLRLTREEVAQIARDELKRLLDREGIVGRRLAVDTDQEVLDFVVERGYDERYGARALKRELQRLVIMPIATLLMEQRVDEGSILKLSVRDGAIRVTVVETEQSRANRRDMEPVRLKGGRKIDREALLAMLDQARAQLAAIVSGVSLDSKKAERAELEARRRGKDLWNNPMEAAAVLSGCERIDSLTGRLASLETAQSDIASLLSRSSGRAGVEKAGECLLSHLQQLACTHRELLLIGDIGFGDALIEIRPITKGRPIRDLLYKTYAAWAEERSYGVTMVCEPASDDDPVIVTIAGPFAFGYLRAESGHHRLQTGENVCVARVRVVPLHSSEAPVRFTVQKALKQVGQYGGRVRSRVEVENSDLVVQNARALAENREFANEVGPSWLAADRAPDTIIRRYSTEPFLVRDSLTETSTGRTDILHGRPFHVLLCRRIDALAESGQ